MKNKILVTSREEFKRLKLSCEDAVISFFDVGTEPVSIGSSGADICPVELDDIDSDEPGFDHSSFFPEAGTVAEFVVRAVAAGKNVICQCEYGMSRSAGCAAAILEHYEGSGITVFADDRYCPNKAVFRKLLGALRSARSV